jgi:hypothetical protein
MDFDLPELANLTVKGTVSLLVIMGFADTIITSALAAKNGTFNGAFVTHFIWSHGVRVWLPVILFTVLGHGIAPLDVPAIGAAQLAANGFLVAYAIATLKSIYDAATGDTAPVA